MKATKTDIQIRFADIDMLGHVNNVNLQHYYDLGKSEYFDQILGSDIIPNEQGVITARTETDYMEQTRHTDKIFVETSCEKIGSKSVTIYQRIVNHETGKVHSQSRTALVCYNFPRQETIEIPTSWRSKLEHAMHDK